MGRAAQPVLEQHLVLLHFRGTGACGRLRRLGDVLVGAASDGCSDFVEELGLGSHQVVGDGYDVVVVSRGRASGGEDGRFQPRHLGLVGRTMMLILAIVPAAVVLAPVRLLLLLLLLRFFLEPHAGVLIAGGHVGRYLDPRARRTIWSDGSRRHRRAKRHAPDVVGRHEKYQSGPEVTDRNSRVNNYVEQSSHDGHEDKLVPLR